MCKILIVDSQDPICSQTEGLLSQSHQVRVEDRGETLYPLLADWKPDCLVLHMTVPGLDGAAVLEYVSRLTPRPEVLVVTGYKSNYLEYLFDRYPVSYVICQPESGREVAQRVEDMIRFSAMGENLLCRRRKAAGRLLRKLGVSSKLQGWEYLCRAVSMKLEDPAQLLTKELYPAVGQVYGADGVQVERCIRTAIVKAWKTCDTQVWGRMFGFAPDGSVAKPSNKTFISGVTEALELELEPF